MTFVDFFCAYSFARKPYATGERYQLTALDAPRYGATLLFYAVWHMLLITLAKRGISVCCYLLFRMHQSILCMKWPVTEDKDRFSKRLYCWDLQLTTESAWRVLTKQAEIIWRQLVIFAVFW